METTQQERTQDAISNGLSVTSRHGNRNESRVGMTKKDMTTVRTNVKDGVVYTGSNASAKLLSDNTFIVYRLDQAQRELLLGVASEIGIHVKPISAKTIALKGDDVSHVLGTMNITVVNRKIGNLTHEMEYFKLEELSERLGYSYYSFRPAGSEVTSTITRKGKGKTDATRKLEALEARDKIVKVNKVSVLFTSTQARNLAREIMSRLEKSRIDNENNIKAIALAGREKKIAALADRVLTRSETLQRYDDLLQQAQLLLIDASEIEAQVSELLFEFGDMSSDVIKALQTQAQAKRLQAQALRNDAKALRKQLDHSIENARKLLDASTRQKNSDKEKKSREKKMLVDSTFADYERERKRLVAAIALRKTRIAEIQARPIVDENDAARLARLEREKLELEQEQAEKRAEREARAQLAGQHSTKSI